MLIDISKVYIPDKKNLFFENPLLPGNELAYGYNMFHEVDGYHFNREMFYLIDFMNIKNDMYYISSYGRIFSITSGKEMSSINSTGYRRLVLRTNDGQDKSFSVHRLVATAFIPKSINDVYLNRDIVNHMNTIKSDNYYRNLEWCTPKENTIHTHENNTTNRISVMTYAGPEIPNGWKTSNNFGEDIGLSRLTNEQAHIICRSIVAGLSNGQCCIEAGLENNEYNRTIVCNIKAGRRWQNIARQYGITAEEKRTKTLDDKSRFVIPVCELLVKGHTIKEITQILPIDENYDRARMFVSGIKNRKYFKEISKDYIF